MLSLTAMLQDAPTRFLALSEQVEGEEDDGVHGLARECSYRRRDEPADELGFRIGEEIVQREKKRATRVSSRSFIELRSAPRHAADRGGVDSSEEDVVSSSTGERKRMMMDSSPH
jgi:hypothetical protein